MLRMQARSMDRYVSPDIVEEIVVIENTPPELPDGWRERVAPEFGQFQNLVRFVRSREVADIPVDVSGWYSQQILKLKIAPLVRSRFYLVLDAKNVFVFPFGREHVDVTGKPRFRLKDFSEHPARHYLDSAAEYYGLSPIRHSLPMVTPFFVPREIALELVAYVEAKEQRPFEQVFPTLNTGEFLMIGAHVLSPGRRFEDIYDLSGHTYPVIWTELARDEAKVAEIISRIESGRLSVFAIHRNAFVQMSAASREKVVEFLIARGLLSHPEEGTQYISQNVAAAEEANRRAAAGAMAWDSSTKSLVEALRSLGKTARCILIDDAQIDLSQLDGQQVVRFMEDHGLPPDAAAAIRELTKLIRLGAEFLVIAWPSFWWLDHYPEFTAHLSSTHVRLAESDTCKVFKLSPA